MTGRRRTFVVIDDHPAVRMAVCMLLSDLEWLDRVGEAEDGADGIALISRLVPDVAVVDIRMPGTDGLDVARACREIGLPTRIVLHTAFTSEGVLAAATDAGAYACVAKGAARNELAAAVERACGRSAVEPPIPSQVRLLG